MDCEIIFLKIYSKDIPLLRDEIGNKYGNKASEAFEMAIWLAVSPLSDDEGRQKAISHSEKLAERIGLDNAYKGKKTPYLNIKKALKKQ